jgi:hypothetical protein
MASDVQPGSVRPRADAVGPAAQSLLGLVEDQLPTQFQADEDEWHCYAAAFV